MIEEKTNEEDEFDEEYKDINEANKRDYADINEANFQEFGSRDAGKTIADMSDEEFSDFMRASYCEYYESLSKRTRISIINLNKYKILQKVYRQIKEILEADFAEYTIEIDDHKDNLTIVESITLVIETSNLSISKKIETFREIMQETDVISIYPLVNHDIRINITIDNVYEEVDEEEVDEEY